MDSASSGQSVGVNEIVQVFDVNGMSRPKATLAVDLSIWICESMTTFGINEQHSNPSLHLVFTRTMKLLSLGVGLIFVIEGKQRVMAPDTTTLTIQGAQHEKFRKRRSGTIFWKACNDCQRLLELLGVPVVRAKSEGEALCALLCTRGIVDGVISNDGDCLLFGANVVYTKYSNENLDNGRVMRYTADSLHAIIDPNEETMASTDQRVKFSRHDLIAFAVLTGSDMTGKGLDKVGHKKALRFIRKCQIDNPLTTETAAYDEMKSWAVAATANFQDFWKDTSKCCTRCQHAGSKRSHAKDGCIQCGTNPGEACYHVTTEDRLRQSLRAKALEMQFNPSKVFDNYLRPNENQLPIQLLTSGVKMGLPKLAELMQMDLVVKGHCRHGSQAFVRQSVLRLLSRYEMSGVHDSTQNVSALNRLDLIHYDRPVAKSISKRLVHHGTPSYELVWVMNATLTDANGEGVDGYEYVTIEPKTFVEEKYPQLVSAFESWETTQSKQGDGMKNWRLDFLKSFGLRQPEQVQELIAVTEQPAKKKPMSRLDKKRKGHFSNKMPVHKRHRTVKHTSGCHGEDIRNLLRFASHKDASSMLPHETIRRPFGRHKGLRHALLTPNSRRREFVMGRTLFSPETPNINTHAPLHNMPRSSPMSMTVDHPADELCCTMGAYNVPITPIRSNQGKFPPHHIFLRPPPSSNN